MSSQKSLLASLILFLFCIFSCSQNDNYTRKNVEEKKGIEEDNEFWKFTNKYLSMDYPTFWKVKKEKDKLWFYLPEESPGHSKSPSFRMTFRESFALSNSKIFFESQKDFPSQEKKYFQEEIAGKLATAYRIDASKASNGNKIVNIRYWFEVCLLYTSPSPRD